MFRLEEIFQTHVRNAQWDNPEIDTTVLPPLLHRTYGRNYRQCLIGTLPKTENELFSLLIYTIEERISSLFTTILHHDKFSHLSGDKLGLLLLYCFRITALNRNFFSFIKALSNHHNTNFNIQDEHGSTILGWCIYRLNRKRGYSPSVARTFETIFYDLLSRPTINIHITNHFNKNLLFNITPAPEIDTLLYLGLDYTVQDIFNNQYPHQTFKFRTWEPDIPYGLQYIKNWELRKSQRQYQLYHWLHGHGVARDLRRLILAYTISTHQYHLTTTTAENTAFNQHFSYDPTSGQYERTPVRTQALRVEDDISSILDESTTVEWWRPPSTLGRRFLDIHPQPMYVDLLEQFHRTYADDISLSSSESDQPE